MGTHGNPKDRLRDLPLQGSSEVRGLPEKGTSNLPPKVFTLATIRVETLSTDSCSLSTLGLLDARLKPLSHAAFEHISALAKCSSSKSRGRDGRFDAR